METRQKMVLNSAACVNILTIIIRWLVARPAIVCIGDGIACRFVGVNVEIKNERVADDLFQLYVDWRHTDVNTPITIHLSGMNKGVSCWPTFFRQTLHNTQRNCQRW